MNLPKGSDLHPSAQIAVINYVFVSPTTSPQKKKKKKEKSSKYDCQVPAVTTPPTRRTTISRGGGTAAQRYCISAANGVHSFHPHPAHPPPTKAGQDACRKALCVLRSLYWSRAQGDTKTEGECKALKI